jgi:serine/threonine protein kinase
VTHHCSSAEDLLAQLSRDQVVSADDLRRYLAQRGGPASLPADVDDALGELVSDGVLTQFQAEQVAAGNAAALRVGKYLLLDRVGSTHSSVYRARKLPAGGPCALKLLAADQSDDRGTVERFRREAEALARTDHPGIVGIKELGEDAGRLFLAMDLVEGQTLVEKVQQEGPLAPLPAVGIIQQALEAVGHLHHAGLVHRDLRPAHLMVDGEGHVRIVDLGVARFLEDRAGALTRKFDAGRVLGSLEYQSPEQMIDSHEVDIRADIYALGATFYYLLTGKAPFNHAALLRLAAGVVTRPQPLTQARPEVPPALAAIVEKMMAPGAEDRYRTPGEAGRALEAWLQQALPSSKKPRAKTPAPGAAAPAESENWALVLAVAAGTALLALAAGMLWRG